MLRLLNSSVFNNNPNQGDFNPNFVSNSRKILDSGLFETWLELFTENIEKNLHTHDVVMVSWMHLITFVFYDLPAQISKAYEHLLPNLFNSLEKRLPNWNRFYIALLKLITAVTVHEKERECLKYITTHRKCIKVPVEPGYGYHFINWVKTYEYNSNIKDILRVDEDMINRAIELLVLD